MTRNKDQKRLVRARMGKTGESYTAARAVLLREQGARDVVDAAPRAQWAALAGMGDDAVAARTGRTWAQWVSALDADQAHRLEHRDIAALLATRHGLDAWWSQTVTVGYERIRGLRDVGQRRGGSYDANKSRTFPVDRATLYRQFGDARRRRRWLPDGPTRVRTASVDRSMRFDWDDGTRVHLAFLDKGPGKCTLTVQHTRLASRAAVERAKAFWHERLDALRDALG